MFDIIEKFEAAPWQAFNPAGREFVRHRNSNPSPGKIRIVPPHTDAVGLTVILPTLAGSRAGSFQRLLKDIANQSMTDFELIVVKGDPRQGRAINTGAALSRGRFFLTLDDDTVLPDPDTFRKLTAVMDARTDIGIAGGNNVIPAGASAFVRRAMKEIPRRSWKPVCDITDSDLAEHPCMIMRTDEFKAVGGENELIPRGLDPYLRDQFRKIGKRVVVVPKVIYHHVPPDTLPKLLRRFFRNGSQAAYTHRHYPQWIIETPPDHRPFRSRVSYPFRLIRFPFRLLKGLVTGKPIWIFSEIAYAMGYICEMSKGEKQREILPGESRGFLHERPFRILIRILTRILTVVGVTIRRCDGEDSN